MYPIIVPEEERLPELERITIQDIAEYHGINLSDLLVD
jgi:hypothetical protein